MSTVEYATTKRFESESCPGVHYTIRKMSFGQRLELTRRVRDLASRFEFLAAGSDLKEKIEATSLAQEIDDLYLRWGLKDIEELEMDGVPATPEALIEIGPEALCQEIVLAIKAETGLTEAERKN